MKIFEVVSFQIEIESIYARWIAVEKSSAQMQESSRDLGNRVTCT